MQKLLLMVVAVVMVGCAGPLTIPSVVKINNANMAKLSVGMTKAQVLEVMGPAGKTESYETKTGEALEFLMYRSKVASITSDEWDEMYATDEHWTPICIINGKVSGWGRNFYDDTIKIRKEIIRD